MKRIALHTLSLAIASALTAPLAIAQNRLPIAAWQPSPAEIESATGTNLLALRSGIFDPTRETLQVAGSSLEGIADSRYAVVQLHALSRSAEQSLKQLRMDVVGFIPNAAYVVRLNGQTLDLLAANPSVRFATMLPATWKIDPAFMDGAPVAASVTLTVHGFAGEKANGFAAALRKAVPSADIELAREDARLPLLNARVPGAMLNTALSALARLDGVHWITRYRQPFLVNDDSIGPMQASTATGSPIWDRDIIGTGQIVAISDSGLDRNESWFTRYNNGSGVVNAITDAESPTPPAIGTVHPTRKVYGYFVQPGATAYDNNVACPGGTPTGFHGTHVVGSVAGDRNNTATPTDPQHDANGDDGMAPNAQILFQDIGNDTSGCLSGLGNLPDTIRQAYAAGAYISSNSWGASTNGAYTTNDIEVDATAREVEQLLFVVAAGNDGPGATTIGSPGNAKNALTVGALGHGNSTTIASFSSLGPTVDTRIKPDIVAPGSAIVSASGNTNNTTTEQTGTSKSLSGTSMATPTIAGSLALMRQYFEDGYYPRGAKTAADAYSPNGPMLKALALNRAQVLGTWPSNTFGWGRLALESTLYFNTAIGGGASTDATRTRIFERENDTGLSTGEQHEYTLGAVASGQELRVTLTWFDLEALPAAAVTLINNLDLEVVGPGGTVFKGNQFTSGASTPNPVNADARNSVEQIRITAPTAGSYTLRVKGTAVPGNGAPYSNRQGYALVASGAFGIPDPASNPAPTGLAAASNNSSGVAISFTGSATQGFQLYRADGSCAQANNKAFRLVATGASSPFVDDRTQGGYTYAYKVRGVSSDVEGAASACFEVTSNDTCDLLPSFDSNTVTRDFSNSICSVSLNWQAAVSNCPTAPISDYQIERSTSPLFTAPTSVTIPAATSYVDTTALGGTPYYYRVTALDDVGNASLVSRILNATPVGPQGPSGNLITDDVDTGTFMNMSGTWATSNVRASNGTFSYRNATGGTNYIPDTCADIATQPFVVAPAGQLQFDARWNLENEWDGVVVEISTNGGSTWNTLTPVGGYPGTLAQTGAPPVNACGYSASQAAFTGSSGSVFQAKSIDLTAFAGQSVIVRWRFSSDPGSEEEGFYLDNVRIPAVGPDANDLLKSGFEDNEQIPGTGPAACAPVI